MMRLLLAAAFLSFALVSKAQSNPQILVLDTACYKGQLFERVEQMPIYKNGSEQLIKKLKVMSKIKTEVYTELRKKCNKCNVNRKNTFDSCISCGSDLEVFYIEKSKTQESYEQTAAEDYLDYLESQW